MLEFSKNSAVSFNNYKLTIRKKIDEAELQFIAPIESEFDSSKSLISVLGLE